MFFLLKKVFPAASVRCRVVTLFCALTTTAAMAVTEPVFYLNADRFSLNFTGTPVSRNNFSPYYFRQHFDNSRHGYLALVYDDVDPSVSMPVAGKCGPATGGEALRFDGSRSFGEVAIARWLPLAGGNLELTVSAWVYVDAIRPGRQTVLARDKNIWWYRYGEKPNPNSDNYGFFLGLENGYARFSIATVGGIAAIPAASSFPAAKLPTARWVHLAGVYRGATYTNPVGGGVPPGRVELYVDGNLIYSVPHNFYLFFSNERIALGATLMSAATDTWAEFFPGRIDEVKVYDTGLTGSQVRQLRGCGMQTF